MLEGIKIVLGGHEFVAPPLPLKVFRVHPEWFAALENTSGLPTPESVGIMTGIVHSALVRNYPGLTLEELEDMLDIVSMPLAMAAVMGQTRGEAERP
jgi:hypothetical protein